MDEARAVKGTDMRLEVHRIRSAASRDRHGDVVWLNFAVPHKHLVIVATVTSARTNYSVLVVGPPFLLSN
jgi:hypothetical protein